MVRALAVAALALTLHPSFTTAQCSDGDRSALLALDQSWGEATRTGDAAALGGYLADNYAGSNLITTTDKATTIANAVRNAAAAKLNPNPNAQSSDRYVISCTPYSAVISHRTVSTPPAGGTGLPSYGRSIHFLERHGAKWQAVSSTGGPISEQQQLTYLEMDWNDAAKNHDASWLENNYAPFASDVNSLTGAIDRKAAAVKSAGTDKTVYESLDLSELTTRIEGDAAVVTGVNHVKGKDADGKPFDRRVRFTDTFIKRDGRWMVWATQGTTIK